MKNIVASGGHSEDLLMNEGTHKLNREQMDQTDIFIGSVLRGTALFITIGTDEVY